MVEEPGRKQTMMENNKRGSLYKRRSHYSAATSWPSGLRRNVKAVVFVGVGSNPTDVIAFANHLEVETASSVEAV